MGHSKAQKEANHNRIIEAAMDLLRHKGLDHMGVAEVMRAAGLTHGGFYSHFDSREAMVAEALCTAFARDERRLDKAAAQRGGEKRRAMLEAYLSPGHRDNPVKGCTVAALTGDFTRADPALRHIFTEQVRRYRDQVAAMVPGAAAEGQALFAFSAMIGALLMARAVDDEALSDEILAAARRHLAAAIEPE
ncbi:TetR/AcrR family transcriptional regulator [Zavarzinia compransoris]|uniref:TetR/AcrR family transcriptional regulator n=1 Tax=Zavarzinia compransoris TaxID=1264899 RepID=A0A317E0K6_9PROT|nr:TetR/AcrR family transcriptional regulator [Zavarzinia compransoris]PWR18893.1 TetR/AcrR family transcriptional regulator [Zavarzinia compransoris]TDP48888.1 TetR family transcriptional regulator [Zavarzinia compransoris]